MGGCVGVKEWGIILGVKNGCLLGRLGAVNLNDNVPSDTIYQETLKVS